MKTSSLMTGSRGFTLVELLTAMFVAMIIMGATVSAMITGSRNQNVAQQITDGRQNARMALQLLERDLRGAGSRVFAGISPCGGAVYAPTTFSDLNDYRNAGELQLTKDIYPITVTTSNGKITEIRVRSGGLGTAQAPTNTFEVKTATTGAPTMTITLQNAAGAPHPDPEWGTGTLLLGCGGNLDAMGGVIYKVQSGSFGSGYTVTCDQFVGSVPEADEANFIRSNPLVVMDVTYLAQEVTYQIDRSAKELRMRVGTTAPFQTILSGITDLRLLSDTGATFDPMAAGDTSKILKIDVDSEGADSTTITMSSVVSLRNIP